MSNNRPTADELRQGMTVEIVQEDATVESADEEPIVGEVATIYGDEPDGPHVELKTGVVGHVQSVVADE
ncbi:YwbE family protein [Halobacteria archaeon AArc-dxtr1]|nr:YwbE family protein [Halobacteria archaeon AArc-dxtr1]